MTLTQLVSLWKVSSLTFQHEIYTGPSKHLCQATHLFGLTITWGFVSGGWRPEAQLTPLCKMQEGTNILSRACRFGPTYSGISDTVVFQTLPLLLDDIEYAFTSYGHPVPTSCWWTSRVPLQDSSMIPLLKLTLLAKTFLEDRSHFFFPAHLFTWIAQPDLWYVP